MIQPLNFIFSRNQLFQYYALCDLILCVISVLSYAHFWTPLHHIQYVYTNLHRLKTIFCLAQRVKNVTLKKHDCGFSDMKRLADPKFRMRMFTLNKLSINLGQLIELSTDIHGTKCQ